MLVVRHKPLTLTRLRASLIYRMGAVPRGEALAETYVEPVVTEMEADLHRGLRAKDDEIEMLRLQVDVAQSDGAAREKRLQAMEAEVGLHSRLLSRIVRATQAIVDDGD